MAYWEFEKRKMANIEEHVSCETRWYRRPGKCLTTKLEDRWQSPIMMHRHWAATTRRHTPPNTMIICICRLNLLRIHKNGSGFLGSGVNRAGRTHQSHLSDYLRAFHVHVEIYSDLPNNWSGVREIIPYTERILQWMCCVLNEFIEFIDYWNHNLNLFS